MNARFANLKDRPRPLEFLEARHAADYDVGTQPTTVAPERVDRAVRGHEQRQDGETILRIPALDAAAGPRPDPPHPLVRARPRRPPPAARARALAGFATDSRR